MNKQDTKVFIVAAISSNSNSFGLNQFVLIAKDGEAWAACRSRRYSTFVQGDKLFLSYPIEDSLSKLRFEIPDRLIPDFPPAVVQAVWGKEVAK